MKKLYLLLLLPLFPLSGCEKTDTTPSWVVLDNFQLTTDEPTQGLNTNSISDAWVYMDNQPLGVFELPCEIPVLAEGSHDFIIYPGVKRHGVSADRTKYPFYERFDTTLYLEKSKKLQVTPTTHYKSNVQFLMLEDFEDVGIDFISDPISTVDMDVISDVSDPDIVKYGSKCGIIELTLQDSVYKGASNLNLTLPQGGESYVEIDYLCNNSAVLSLIAKNSGGSQSQLPLAGFNVRDLKKENWRKLYIDLKENVSYEINATSFEIYILSVLDEGNSGGLVYIDNVKVLRFQ